MTDVFFSYETNKHLHGSQQRVLLTDISPDGHHYVSHNKSYVQVLVPRPCSLGGQAAFGDSYMLGKMVEVTVVSVAKHHVMGEIASIEDLLKAPKRPPAIGGTGLLVGGGEVQVQRRPRKRDVRTDPTLDDALTPTNSDDEEDCGNTGSCTTGGDGSCSAKGCGACGEAEGPKKDCCESEGCGSCAAEAPEHAADPPGIAVTEPFAVNGAIRLLTGVFVAVTLVLSVFVLLKQFQAAGSGSVVNERDL